MKNGEPCSEEHSNCIMEKKDELMCIKWFDVDLKCIDLHKDLHKFAIGK